MNDGKPLRHADDRIGASRMQPKELFRCAKAANWLFIRRNRLNGDRRSQVDCISREFEPGSTKSEAPHRKSRMK